VLALIPGTSRSGITISSGLLVGFTREAAIKFSFLLGLPVMLGAGFLKLIDLWKDGFNLISPMVLSVGFLSAFVSGWLTVSFLLHFIKKRGFGIFVIYRIILALIIFIVIL
jgi:undecaprenyl-diphosphatase